MSLMRHDFVDGRAVQRKTSIGLNGPVASEEMLFESVDVILQTTTDNCLSYELPGAFGSGELKT